MRPLPCFIYRDGEHFSLSPGLRAARPHLCLFALADETGTVRPHPQVFRESGDPDEAVFFLFPWDIGAFADQGRTEELLRLIDALPYFRGRERRHIFVDFGDSPACLPREVRLFKVSLAAGDERRAVPLWFPLPAHVLAERPDFDWQGIRYDCAFVGNLSSPLRKAAVLAVQRQQEALRLLVDLDHDLEFHEGHFVKRPPDEQGRAARRAVYLRAMKSALTVLCPPGVGLQSLRLYETLYFGRIPVLFGDKAVYPLSGRIDYNAFCLRIPDADLPRAGAVLAHWLRGQSREELRERCVLACRTWNRHFAPQLTLPTLLEEAARIFGDDLF